MEVEKIKDQRVKEFFRYALSQPPSAAGLRLRSEPELASLVGIGRWRIRGALENLIQEGILVKRKGSGAYVRKVPAVPEGVETGNFTEFESITPKDLFAQDSKIDRRTSVLRPTGSQKKLNLNVCAHVYLSAPSHQAILGGIVDRANQLGHGISLTTFVDQHEEMLPIPERQERLANNHCDGYLVMDGYAKEFYEAVQSKDIPVLFGTHSCWKHVAHYEPKVALDDLEAISRGIEVLAGEGYRRIGMIGVEARYHPVDLEEKMYHDTVTRCGLEYRKIKYLPFNLSQIIESVQKLFSQSDRPDAIYVNDDYIMVGVAEALELMGLKAGRDVGVITLSTTHHHLPRHNQWSRMEFNLRQFGEVLVDNLLRLIETADHRLNNIMFQARWVAGQSHQRTQGKP